MALANGDSLTQTGNISTKVYTQTLQATETYNHGGSDNADNGGFSRNRGGGGNVTINEHGTDNGVPYTDPQTVVADNFFLDTTGNYVDGQTAIRMNLGQDRYDLLNQFNDTSNLAAGGSVGTVDFSPVGAPFFVGAGVTPPTGGAAFDSGRAAADAVFSDLGGTAGSQQGTMRGLEAVGPFEHQSGYAVSHAATQAAFAELGGAMAHEYCFAAGTPILMADGTSKPIEEIQPGEQVLAADEHNPEGPVEAREVVEIYHNKPARLLELHLGGEIIRATLNHPIYARAKGWTAASELEAGDELRTHNGGWVKLEKVVDKEEIEPVYNLQVRACHTYFVGDRTWQFSVLVHNESPSAGAGGNRPFRKRTADPTEGMTWAGRVWFSLTADQSEIDKIRRAEEEREALERGASKRPFENNAQWILYKQLTMPQAEFIAWQENRLDQYYSTAQSNTWLTGATGINRTFGSAHEATVAGWLYTGQEYGYGSAVWLPGGMFDHAIIVGGGFAGFSFNPAIDPCPRLGGGRTPTGKVISPSAFPTFYEKGPSTRSSSEPNIGGVRNGGLRGFEWSWGDMTSPERQAFQHAYVRHHKEFGLPNWAETKADTLFTVYNAILEHIRTHGTFVGVQRTAVGTRGGGKPAVSTPVRVYEYSDPAGRSFYYYETLNGRFVSAGLKK